MPPVPRDAEGCQVRSGSSAARCAALAAPGPRRALLQVCAASALTGLGGGAVALLAALHGHAGDGRTPLALPGALLGFGLGMLLLTWILEHAERMRLGAISKEDFLHLSE